MRRAWLPALCALLQVLAVGTGGGATPPPVAGVAFAVVGIASGVSVAWRRRFPPPVFAFCPRVIVAECVVAGAFAVVAGAAVTGSAWILVAGFGCHAAKDFWQHRTHFVNNTRWWPPFRAVVDVVVATSITAVIVSGAGLTG